MIAPLTPLHASVNEWASWRTRGRCYGGIAMEKRVDHVVTRPGRRDGDPDVQIPVAEDLTTVPGIPLRETDLSFYSRTYPQETQNIEKAADRQWVWTVYKIGRASCRERR